MSFFTRHGMLLSAFERAHKDVMGNITSYKAMRFSCIYDILVSIPELVEVQELENGHILLVVVSDENTNHIARMVENQ